MADDDLRSRAAALFAHGQFEDAKSVYLQLLAATESTSTDVVAQLHANLSACCIKLDRTSDAIQHALVCVQLRPAWNKAHFRLLSALLAANAWVRAYRAALAAQCALSAPDYASIQDVVTRACAQHVLRWYAPLCGGGTVHVEWLSAERGKGVVVSRSVSGALPVGTVLFSEKPLAAHRWVQLEAERALDSCSHCMMVRVDRKLLGDRAADVFLPRLPTLPELVPCGGVRCTALFCSDVCRAEAVDTYHAALCPGDDARRAALVADLYKLSSDTDRTNVLIIARLLASAAQALRSGRAATADDSLQSLINFSFYSAPAPGDMALQRLLSELICDGFEARAVVTTEWIQRINGLLLCNASELNPVTSLHLFLAQCEPDERRALLRRAGLPAHLDIVDIPELKAMCQHGTGLYAVNNSANHSCKPNAALASTTVDHTLALISQQELRAGQEVTIAYCDENLPRSKRREHLRDMYRFECRCERCGSSD
jgi:hypothetical protein